MVAQKKSLEDKSPGKKSFSRHARIRARRSVVQALYQWGMSDAPIQDVINEFVNERSELKKADTDYFKEILLGTVKESKNLDEQLMPFVQRVVVILLWLIGIPIPIIILLWLFGVLH